MPTALGEYVIETRPDASLNLNVLNRGDEAVVLATGTTMSNGGCTPKSQSRPLATDTVNPVAGPTMESEIDPSFSNESPAGSAAWNVIVVSVSVS